MRYFITPPRNDKDHFMSMYSPETQKTIKEKLKQSFTSHSENNKNSLHLFSFLKGIIDCACARRELPVDDFENKLWAESQQIMVAGHYLKKEGIIANRLEPEQVAGREEPHGTNRQRRRAVLGSVGSLSTAWQINGVNTA